MKIPDIHRNPFILEAKETLSMAGSKRIPGSLLPPGVIHVSCVGTIGEVSMGIMCCHTNQQIHSIIPSDPKHQLLMFSYFRSLEGELKNMASGSTVAPQHKHLRFREDPRPDSRR